MSATLERRVLRDDLLTGVSVVVARAPDSGFAAAVSRACAAAGARVIQWPVPVQADTGEVAPQLAGADVLVNDAAGFYAHALRDSAGDGLAALRACVDTAWRATRTLAGVGAGAGAGAVAGADSGGGRVISVAPPADAGVHAEAARAALENLARTLSIEWARHRITTVAVAPGASTTAHEVGTIVAFLASRAGAYFSGCQLDLRGPAPARGPARR